MGITRWARGQHATTAALLIAIVASILTRYARASTRYSMHKHLHQEHLHGIRKDLRGYMGKTVYFEAFDLADVMIIGN
jgi:hypothetical protein